MFECPSRLKQWGATCLIQTRRNLRVTVYVETAAPLPFAHPHCSFFPHSRNNHTPPFLAYSQCKSPAGSFVYNTAGKRKCHLGTPPPLFFKTFTFFISCSTCCACKPRVRWTELHFSKGKLLSATRKKTYTQGTLLPSPCTLYISLCLTSPYTVRIWQEMSEHWGTNMCVCVWQDEAGEGVGESNLSHRGAETGGQIRSKPGITPAVSMNEMTGLQGY